MATYKKKFEKWQAKLGTNVFDPLQVMDMQDAIRKRAKKANIQGRKFILSYRVPGLVYYHPENEFIPAGYLEIKKFLERI